MHYYVVSLCWLQPRFFHTPGSQLSETLYINSEVRHKQRVEGQIGHKPEAEPSRDPRGKSPTEKGKGRKSPMGESEGTWWKWGEGEVQVRWVWECNAPPAEKGGFACRGVCPNPGHLFSTRQVRRGHPDPRIRRPGRAAALRLPFALRNRPGQPGNFSGRREDVSLVGNLDLRRAVSLLFIIRPSRLPASPSSKEDMVGGQDNVAFVRQCRKQLTRVSSASPRSSSQ